MQLQKRPNHKVNRIRGDEVGLSAEEVEEKLRGKLRHNFEVMSHSVRVVLPPRTHHCEPHLQVASSHKRAVVSRICVARSTSSTLRTAGS